MRRVAPVVIALVLVAAACAQPPTESGPSGASEEAPQVSESSGEIIVSACTRVVTALQEGDTATLISSLEDIDAALSSNPDVVDLREYIRAAGEAFTEFEDTPLSAEQLSSTAGPLVELSNGLIAAGLDECADIGATAAGFTGPVDVDPKEAASALATNRATWDAEGPDTYWMELSFGAGGGSRDAQCAWNRIIVAQVVDDRAASAVTKSPGCVVDIDDPDGVPLTVEDLFALVESSGDTEVFEVEYNPVLGYPRMLFVDGDGFFYEARVMSFAAGVADTSQADAVLTELETQREIWTSAGVSSYAMTVQIDCFCPEEFRGPFDVTVVDGVIETATWKGDPIPMVANRAFLTIESLFDQIEARANADSISVAYAPLGYPVTIRIDPDRNTADEELGVRVLDFTVGD